jgi:hypothetical protein
MLPKKVVSLVVFADSSFFHIYIQWLLCFTMSQIKLTICEGEDGTESSNGDVLIFPDMIRYK